MAETEGNSPANCCGGTNQDSGASCGCGTSGKRRSKLRTLIFVAIMLAAVGVGTYSLFAKSAAPVAKQDCSGDCGKNCCGK